MGSAFSGARSQILVCNCLNSYPKRVMIAEKVPLLVDSVILLCSEMVLTAELPGYRICRQVQWPGEDHRMSEFYLS